MSNNNTQDQQNTFSHTAYENVKGIFKGISTNNEGTYFANIALPSGKDQTGKQAYINVSAIVGKAPALQALASGLCDTKINEGKGTSAFVSLTNVMARNSFDDKGNIQSDSNNIPYINYYGFLNGISFS